MLSFKRSRHAFKCSLEGLKCFTLENINHLQAATIIALFTYYLDVGDKSYVFRLDQTLASNVILTVVRTRFIEGGKYAA